MRSPMYCLGRANKMDSLKVSLFVLCAVVLLGAQSVFGIRCYQCNSGYKYAGDTCLDKVKLAASGDKYLVECADQETKDRMPNGTYKICRTFSQTVIDEYRLIRQCASSGRVDKCIERTGTKDIKVTYCHCDKDGCNGASTLYSTITLTLSVLTAAWTLVHRT